MIVLGACKAKKNTCYIYEFESEDAEMVEAQGDMTMISYPVKEGPLKGHIIEVMANQMTKESELNLVHHDPDKILVCTYKDKDNWKLTEEKDHIKQQMKFSLSCSVICGGKSYCITMKYEGALLQMPRTPHNPDMETPTQPIDTLNPNNPQQPKPEKK